jgi:adenine-specific DNA-methyltransferase
VERSEDMPLELGLMDVSYWRKELGLLPVPLFSSNEQARRFVLLNGSRGNFCLDFVSPQVSDETRNHAWSSNVGHYIVVGRNIEVQRWDQRGSAVERYESQSVYRNLEGFHTYLERDVPKQGVSIVSHATGVFRSLRAALGRDYDGSQSLRAFLCLLACCTDNSELRALSLDRWHVSREATDIASSIRTADWEALQAELVNGRALEGLSPNLTLLLRHASGQLFQEAHYEAVFNPQQQMSFGGLLPSSVKITDTQMGTGVHFTPPALARTLVERALSACDSLSERLVVFDPACGSGEFLRETLRQLDLLGYPGHVKLVGWDISEAASDMARFVLAWEKHNSRVKVDFDVRCVDSLESEWPGGVDIVLMNPPFTSWQGMTDQQRQSVTQTLDTVSRIRPDLSHAFLWKAKSCVRTGGAIGTVLPASFLDASSAEHLRQNLAEQMSAKLIARLGSHLLFSGAIIDAALYVARKGEDSREPTVSFWADYRSASNSAGLRALRRACCFPRSGNYPIVGDGFSIYLNDTLGRDEKSWAPRPYEPWRLLNSLSHLPRVRDLFDIKQGIRTGSVKVFTLPKEEWQSLPKEERTYFRPAVVNESIRHGYLDCTRYVFYPYGEKTIHREAELAERVGLFYQRHLLPNKEDLLHRAWVNTDRWWELARYRTWQVSRVPKIVSTYFGDAGSFAWDESGDFVVVQGFAWLPRKRRALPRGVHLGYLAILNSRLFSELLSAASNNVGGGQWNLSKKFLDGIPMPDLHGSDSGSTILSALSEIGHSLHSGEEIDVDRLEAVVRVIYRHPSEL